MKILYDHQIFSAQKYGGISRYFAQIISNLPQDVQSKIALKNSNNEYLKDLKLLSPAEDAIFHFDKFMPRFNFKGKSYLFKIVNGINPFRSIDLDLSTLNKDFSIELLKNQDFDIFHPTYYDDYFLDYIGNKPFVLTIHDMIHELYPEMIKDNLTIQRKAKLASKASHIIAVSEKTKNDIIELLDIKEEKITVIYHASSIIKKSDSLINELPGNYLLFVGDRSIYKNFTFFVYAVKSLLQKRSDLKVICTGCNFSKQEQLLFKELNLENRFLNLYLRKEQFYEVFQKAQALIFPSYYEGFGIPIIEAFDAGCPVILSNSSCFPEIAGDAAIYFEPKNKTQMISAIEKILDDKEYREFLIVKGFERLHSFSWEISTQQTLEVYKNVLNQQKYE